MGYVEDVRVMIVIEDKDAESRFDDVRCGERDQRRIRGEGKNCQLICKYSTSGSFPMQKAFMPVSRKR